MSVQLFLFVAMLSSLFGAVLAFPFCSLQRDLFITRKRNSSLHQGNRDDVQNVDPLPSSALSLNALLRPSTSCDPDQMGGTELAYIGDVVFELFCRSRHVWPLKRTSDLQNQVVAIVCAEYQAALLTKLKETFPLSSKEQQVLMRGRNAGGKNKNRVRNVAAYQDATAFEALLGYLYVGDQRRCEELLRWLHRFVDDVDVGSGSE